LQTPQQKGVISNFQHTFYIVYLVKLIKYQAKDDNTFYQGVEQTTQEDTLEKKNGNPQKELGAKVIIWR
jgi:hypothetical protein